ncbi:MAG: aldehyde dehydrogenase family protein [Flavobacteriales bacterium]|nr:aldehyde dehydrogenase family protein [Flavobacteriales bacterium]MCX7767502.1 aldehyde dehydrogenase family protein [Flavobacteriales bacterium]MDW8409637.1 aldehyde dehydrogenase family protein [Flavobacteriales bacterium]
MKISPDDILKQLGIEDRLPGAWVGGRALEALPDPSDTDNFLRSVSPVDGRLLARVQATSLTAYTEAVDEACQAFDVWKKVPAPKRGEVVRQFGDALRGIKNHLGALVSYEMGKSLQEGLGEVQEMIDICDYAVGLSRQLYGLTMPSERPHHRMYEQWHPLGPVGIITAFNFPVAVWAWNAAIAWVCGDVCIWKPSEKTPVSAVVCQKLIARILEQNGMPPGVSVLLAGGPDVGNRLAQDRRIPLISATGSVRMGRSVAEVVSRRLGRTILELGGNNAIILTPHARLELAVKGVVFGAVGTAGQRCTTTRRLIVHKSIYDKVADVLVKAYAQLRIGNPLDETNHMGPLIDVQAVAAYEKALEAAVAQGGQILTPHGRLTGPGYESGCYVRPVIVAMPAQTEIVREETFAPILYLLQYETLPEALQLLRDVPQGLSSAIFTDNLQEAEYFLSVEGSDCGIANVNIGTSGAEIGGAFGGEKDTGGGRESGSDSWKQYMRRQTNTINFGTSIPLAQGIRFDF